MIKKIAVIAKMTPGNILPIKIVWDNGKEYEIDKIKSIKKLASTKGGGAGVRYECIICGKARYLYLDENTWFVEIL